MVGFRQATNARVVQNESRSFARGNKSFIQNPAKYTSSTTNDNRRPEPRLVVDNTQNADTSTEFNKKYEDNSIEKSVERKKQAIQNANVVTTNLINSQEPHQPHSKIKSAADVAAKVKNLGVALAATTKKLKGLVGLASFLLTPVHVFGVLPLGVVALLGFGVEVAAIDFFTWIPLIGDTLGRLASAIVPGMEIGAIALAATMVIGWGSNVAILVYFLGFAHWKPSSYFTIILVLCFGCYVIPAVQLLPWFLIIALAAIFDMVNMELKK